MDNYALVVNDLVVNTIKWDRESEYQPDSGEILPIPDGINVGVGWSYQDGSFIAPDDFYAEEKEIYKS